MLLPIIYKTMNGALQELQAAELMQFSKECAHGLEITLKDAAEIIDARNRLLQTYGRIEIDLEVTKILLQKLFTSPFISREEITQATQEILDIFYFIKNETEDGIGDSDLIDRLLYMFNGDCHGSIELLKSTAEALTREIKEKNIKSPLLQQGGEINNEPKY
ncbi:MAG: DUF6323 family protein [Bacillota bacterium]|nr:DUF6323 family protein [Bacillota bacterium]